MADSFLQIERDCLDTSSLDDPIPGGLEFDPISGKLRLRYPSRHGSCIAQQMAASGFFGGCFMASQGNESIRMLETSKGIVDVKTIHISCQSDTYQPGTTMLGSLFTNTTANQNGELRTTLTVSLAISSFKIQIQKM